MLVLCYIYQGGPCWWLFWLHEDITITSFSVSLSLSRSNSLSLPLSLCLFSHCSLSLSLSQTHMLSLSFYSPFSDSNGKSFLFFLYNLPYLSLANFNIFSLSSPLHTGSFSSIVFFCYTHLSYSLSPSLPSLAWVPLFRINLFLPNSILFLFHLL